MTSEVGHSDSVILGILSIIISVCMELYKTLPSSTRSAIWSAGVWNYIWNHRNKRGRQVSMSLRGWGLIPWQPAVRQWGQIPLASMCAKSFSWTGLLLLQKPTLKSHGVTVTLPYRPELRFLIFQVLKCLTATRIHPDAEVIGPMWYWFGCLVFFLVAEAESSPKYVQTEGSTQHFKEKKSLSMLSVATAEIIYCYF